jgi:HTH-type transcriptional regulator, competence development regulator
MAKKSKVLTERAGSATPASDPAALGAYLAAIRGVRRLTLREVEEATGGEVSNAYLSQLENNKISRPSPNVLHALARVLVVPYETLMQKAGYFPPATAELDVLRSASSAKKAKHSVFAIENLTPDEEEALIEYLAFLRSRKSGSGSGKT